MGWWQQRWAPQSSFGWGSPRRCASCGDPNAPATRPEARGVGSRNAVVRCGVLGCHHRVLRLLESGNLGSSVCTATSNSSRLGMVGTGRQPRPLIHLLETWCYQCQLARIHGLVWRRRQPVANAGGGIARARAWRLEFRHRTFHSCGCLLQCHSLRLGFRGASLRCQGATMFRSELSCGRWGCWKRLALPRTQSHPALVWQQLHFHDKGLYQHLERRLERQQIAESASQEKWPNPPATKVSNIVPSPYTKGLTHPRESLLVLIAHDAENLASKFDSIPNPMEFSGFAAPAHGLHQTHVYQPTLSKTSPQSDPHVAPATGAQRAQNNSFVGILIFRFTFFFGNNNVMRRWSWNVQRNRAEPATTTKTTGETGDDTVRSFHDSSCDNFRSGVCGHCRLVFLLHSTLSHKVISCGTVTTEQTTKFL